VIRDVLGLLRNLQVRLVPIDQLIPYIRNSRTHTDAQVALVAARIREFGWTNPILIRPDLVVIAGHARLLAARKLGLTEVPVIELSGLSEVQCRALAIADNQLAITGAGLDFRYRTRLLLSSATSAKIHLPCECTDEPFLGVFSPARSAALQCRLHPPIRRGRSGVGPLRR
jgi:hypothetical protein